MGSYKGRRRNHVHKQQQLAVMTPLGGVLQPTKYICSTSIESINPAGKYEWIESERKSHQ